MFRALATAATGMEAQQTQIDVIANNLANVNTAGFKKSRADFQDLLYQTMRPAGATSKEGHEVPVGLQVGLGVRSVASQKMFTTGDFKQTDNPLDLAIEGGGFFQVVQPGGTIAYTRAGAFKTDSQGRIVTGDGYPIEPAISVPPDAVSVTILADGTVSALQANQSTPVELGQIQLATFANPAGLENQGRSLMVPTQASGQPVAGAPGTLGLGTLSQGFLEMSNVKVVEEMIDLISGQRAYEVSARVVQAADEMLRTSAQGR
jgi:flagellar basal-body rod protein FlgG